MAKRKVFIEALGLVDGHFSGIGHYILGVLRGLDEIIEREKLAQRPIPEIEVIIPYDTLGKFHSFGFKHLQPRLFPLSFRFMSGLWYRDRMPPIDLVCGRGHYIFTRFADMPLAFSDSAIIIYDLSFELYKQYSDDRNARFLSKRTKQSVARADTVFTISQNSKREIAEFYGVDPERVKVATPAADQRYFYRRNTQEVASVKREYDIDDDYILALSNLEPRKNLDTLVDAYCSLPKRYSDTTSLLLVGVSGWKTDELFDKIIERVKQGYNIIRPSKYVSDQDLPAIVSGARMLVYPSHYEGFGIPPLEALACGVPVITADNSSLPEVVGDAGALLECTDTKGITQAMRHYLDNLEEVTAKSIAEGPHQARNFSWDESAQIYWNYIQEVAS